MQQGVADTDSHSSADAARDVRRTARRRCMPDTPRDKPWLFRRLALRRQFAPRPAYR